MCVREMEGEWKEEVCVLHCGENLSVCMCVCFEGGSGEPLRGFYF